MEQRDVRIGSGAIAQVTSVAKDLGARRILLVCGRTSFEASGAARVVPDLERDARVHRWSDFEPNPNASDLIRGLEVMATVQPDLVLGVGGGSTMDMAKLLCAFDGITDLDDLTKAITVGDRVTRRNKHLVLAPTTSGSGSEATHFAVVYIDSSKYSVGGPALLPDTVILDPDLTVTSTAYQRATSAIDAVAQAIESLWAVRATQESRRFATDALGHLLQAIEPYVSEPDEASATAMAIGSNLAGRAIDISRTTGAHALSYALTKQYGVSHGHAVALTLGAFIEAHSEATPEELHPAVEPQAHRAAMEQVLGLFDTAEAATARHRFSKLLQRIGLSPGLESVGAGDERAIAYLAASVNHERLDNNPITLDQSGLMSILQRSRGASEGVEVNEQ